VCMGVAASPQAADAGKGAKAPGKKVASERTRVRVKSVTLVF